MFGIVWMPAPGSLGWDIGAASGAFFNVLIPLRVMELGFIRKRNQLIVSVIQLHHAERDDYIG